MKSLSNRSKLSVTLVILVFAALLIGLGTWAAFSSTTSNPGNSFAAGTVVLTDNDGGSAMFNLTGLKPGDTDSKCIKVDYSGSLPAGVKLYGTNSGALGQYLDLKVTRGTISSGAFADCTNFTADATDYNGDGAGVIYDSDLASYPATYAAGITDPTASWTNPEQHAYMFTVTQQDNNAAQGQSATATFTWEARNN